MKMKLGALLHLLEQKTERYDLSDTDLAKKYTATRIDVLGGEHSYGISMCPSSITIEIIKMLLNYVDKDTEIEIDSSLSDSND